MKSILISIPVVLSLAACGGSSTGSSSNSAFNSPQEAINELEFLNDKANRLDLTPVENIPSGSASYEGVFSLAQTVERFPGDTNPNLENPLIGELELTVNFQQDTVSGSADNFFDPDGGVNGSLTISDGEIFRDETGALFGADVTGRLPVAGAQRDIEGGLLGTFGGNQAQLVSGLFAGDADGSIPLIGAFVADN